MGKALYMSMAVLFMLAVGFYAYQYVDFSGECQEEFVRTGSVTGNVISTDIADERINRYVDDNFEFEYVASNSTPSEIEYLDPFWGMRFTATAYVSYKFAVDQAGNVYTFRSCP